MCFCCYFSDVPEFFGVLQRFQQWHFGSIHTACHDTTLVQEWQEYIPMQLLYKANEVCVCVCVCVEVVFFFFLYINVYSFFSSKLNDLSIYLFI